MKKTKTKKAGTETGAIAGEIDGRPCTPEEMNLVLMGECLRNRAAFAKAVARNARKPLTRKEEASLSAWLRDDERWTRKNGSSFSVSLRDDDRCTRKERA